MSRLRAYTPLRRTPMKRRLTMRAVAPADSPVPVSPGVGRAAWGRALTAAAGGPHEKLKLADVTFSDAFVQVALRAGGVCEVVLDGVRCRRRARDQHHTRKPRRTWDTATYRIAVCRPCHDRCEWPYQRGRLVIRALGEGRFACAIVTAPDKFTYRQQGQEQT